MTKAARWYKQRDWDSTGICREVQAAGITHVITAADKDVTCAELELIFADTNYRLYRFRGE